MNLLGLLGRRLSLAISKLLLSAERGEIMVVETMQVAQELAMNEEDVTREALRALLRAKIHSLDAERRARCAKFSVTSLQELDELVRAGKVDEEVILDDFQNVDYLTNRIARLQRMLGDHSVSAVAEHP